MRPLSFWVVDPALGMYGSPEQIWECDACGMLMRNRATFGHPPLCAAKVRP